MENPITDLQTLITASYDPDNITSLSDKPPVQRGKRYGASEDSYINVINQGPPRYDDLGDNENMYITLVCEFIINLPQGTTATVINTASDQVIDELKSIIDTYNVTPGRTHNILFYPMHDFTVDAWIIPMTFDFKYWAVEK